MLLGLIAVASQDRSEFDGMPEQGYVRPPPRRIALWPNRIEKQKQQSWPRRRCCTHAAHVVVQGGLFWLSLIMALIALAIALYAPLPSPHFHFLSFPALPCLPYRDE